MSAANCAPDYRTNDPRGWCGDPKRGAAMGRPSVKEAPKDTPVKLCLRRVHWNAGGYDSNGTYFGSRADGHALWWVADADGSVDFMIDVDGGREDAKRAVRASYPNARFFR